MLRSAEVDRVDIMTDREQLLDQLRPVAFANRAVGVAELALGRLAVEGERRLGLRRAAEALGVGEGEQGALQLEARAAVPATPIEPDQVPRRLFLLVSYLRGIAQLSPPSNV
jgi:hypothetical protein